jgi:2-amino-4-hydroxy-6-hydroxymethyldihydropteridine diphosphokinase
MSKLADCVIGLGSNLGPRLENIRRAVQAISSVCQVVRASRLYETTAVGPPQPDYLNAALRIHCPLGPEALLQTLLETEHMLGRLRRERWGARTIDLDILWILGEQVDSASLKVPHPHLKERAFAIMPLLDVAPEAVDPMTGASYAELAAQLHQGGVRCIAGSAWVEGAVQIMPPTRA